MNDLILDIKGLTVSMPTDHGVLNAVRGIDLRIARGQTLGLVGESGCGKSLTAMAIMGLLPRYARIGADKMALVGQHLSPTDKALARLRGREIAMIFQDPNTSLNPTMTIGRQLTEGVIHTEKLDRKAAEKRAVALLERVGLPQPGDRIRQYPHEFSGGQRQRIMIAAALMGKPKLLIADEPTTALDVTIQAQILALLAELQRDLDLSLMLITHDLGVVAHVATDVAVMYAGRIAEHAPTGQLFSNPCHPYTKGLIKAIPIPGVTPRGSELPAIPGQVPSLIGTHHGCAFRDRCPIAVSDCAEDPVARKNCGPGHIAECNLADGGQDEDKDGRPR